MLHSIPSILTQAIQPTRLSARLRQFFSTVLLHVMVLTVGATAFGAGELLAQSSQNPSYDWTLKSGFFTSEVDETVRVLITDVTESTDGVAVAVRFFDGQSTLLSQSVGVTLPGQPLVASFRNGANQRILVRIEIELLSSDTKVVPATTVEVDRPGSLAVVQKFSCVGPLVREPVEFNCGDEEECPPPAPVAEFNCPEMAHSGGDL
jgi:hypothetical protein